MKYAGRDGERRRRHLGRIAEGPTRGRVGITAVGAAVYLGKLPVSHKGSQGLAHTPLLLGTQVLRDHLDAHLKREREKGVGGGREGS